MMANTPREGLQDEDSFVTHLYGWLVRMLSLGFMLGMALLLVGLAALALRSEGLNTKTDAIRNVLPSAARFESQGIVDLGILVVLLTPLAGVIASLLVLLRQRDARMAGVCVLLIALVLGTAVVKLL